MRRALATKATASLDAFEEISRKKGIKDWNCSCVVIKSEKGAAQNAVQVAELLL